MREQTENDHLTLAASVSAAAMIAFQIGGKATRDALFLSYFPVTALPGLLIASAAFSIVAVLTASRLVSTRGPAAIMPYAFGISSILLLAEWFTSTVAPAATAILLYMHLAGFGAILVSGFWSIIAELFDPRTAKAKIGRITAGATLGGLLGGVIAERVGTMFSITAMLPVLAVFHFACAVLNQRLRTTTRHRKISTTKSGFQVLRDVSYIRQLALLVLIGTIAETLLDYLLKTQAASAFTESHGLIRFFSMFYTGVSLITFFVQAGLSRYSLQQLGLTGTMGTLPIAVVAGGVFSLIVPGLVSVGVVRGAQSVLRSSLFRSGYELLYAPVAESEKRAAKTIVDVGFDKLGDAGGGAIIRILLWAGLAASLTDQLLMLVAVGLGVVAIVLTARLSQEYVITLEKSLLSQAADLDLLDVQERTTRVTLLRTLGTVEIKGLQPRPVSPPKTTATPKNVEIDPMAKALSDLRSSDVAVVRDALAGQSALDPLLAGAAIRLLARDDVNQDAIKALRKIAPSIIGQLSDALLDVGQDFAIRRRVPRVLAYSPSPRAVEGLIQGLADPRFEVRFSCGRALSRICAKNHDLRPRADDVYEAVSREIKIAARLGETPRVLDRYDDQDATSPEANWNSTNIRLEHIFRLLSLCLPREPLQVAFQALHTDDGRLKGTALEYLERILPAEIRIALWQFVEDTSRA